MESNEKLNVLFLAFWTPPVVRPRAITIGKLMPQFIRQGIKPVIITYENDGEWQIKAPIYKIPQFEYDKTLNKIKPRIIAKYLYYKKIRQLAEKLIKQYDIKLIFSFSNPQESNIAGAMIKRRSGIPFISHFSDPWYDNSYKEFSAIAARKVLWLENFIIKNSSRVIFINQAEQDLIMKKFPPSWQDKCRVVRHCFDEKDYPKVIERDNKRFIFSHVGAFYRQRNPEPFFKALSLAIKNNEELAFKIKTQLVGCVPAYSLYTEDKLHELINKYNLNNLIEILPQVPHLKSLEYMKLADCLVIIDANLEKSIFSPSKLFDYAGSQTPIIGITPKNSPTEEFLSKLGCRSFDYNETEKLADYIKRLVNRETKVIINQEYLRGFEVKNIATQYVTIFNEAAQAS